MKYFLNKQNEDGTISQVEAKPERWAWKVDYKDGTELRQFGEDGVFHQLKDIDQDNIELAVLYKMDDPNQVVLIPWKPGMKLIHKYINVHADYFEKLNDTVRVYAFGYKLGGQNHYTYILPNDRQILSPADDINLTLFKL
jgi:hypothetical protein